jgi:hypothetical protein
MTESGPGVILMFGVVLAPLYIMLLGWFLDRPREVRPALIGVGFLIFFTVAAWAGAALFSLILRVAFF